MSTKQDKKYRKSVRKESKDLAEKGYYALALRFARQRDIWGIIAILEAAAIVTFYFKGWLIF